MVGPIAARHLNASWVVGGLNFLHPDMLYASGSFRPRSSMVSSKDLQAILLKDLCDGDITAAKLTIIDKEIKRFYDALPVSPVT